MLRKHVGGRSRVETGSSLEGIVIPQETDDDGALDQGGTSEDDRK